jgi:putative transposase
MPRKPRQEFAGGIHHVYARGNCRQPIYLDAIDCTAYLAHLSQCIDRHGWLCLAYCLMDNHLHLIVETPEPNLGAGMRGIQGDYARRFNKRHDRSGHVFQGRYGSVLAKTDEQLWALLRYVAMNPVRAGLCERPEEWLWSSYPRVLSRTQPSWLATRRLLEFLGAPAADARTRYAELVRQTPTALARGQAPECLTPLSRRGRPARSAA